MQNKWPLPLLGYCRTLYGYRRWQRWDPGAGNSFWQNLNPDKEKVLRAIVSALSVFRGGKKSPKHGGYIGHKCRIPEFMWAHKIAHRSIHFGRCSSSSPQWPPSAFRILLNGLHSHRCPLTLTPSAILSLFLPPRFKNIQVTTPDLTQLCPLCQQTWKRLSSTCCPPPTSNEVIFLFFKVTSSIPLLTPPCQCELRG